MPTGLRRDLHALPEWPLLSVGDWMPLARTWLNLEENLPSGDRRYSLIHLHIKNAKDKMERQKLALADQADEVMAELSHDNKAKDAVDMNLPIQQVNGST